VPARDDRPTGSLPASGAPGADGSPPASDGGSTAEHDEAVHRLWLGVSRPSKVQLVALVLISCLSLGPLAALVLVLRADPDPVLLAGPPPSLDESRVTVTAIGLNPSLGEVRFRVSFQPSVDLAGSGGRLDEPITVGVNAVTGTTAFTFDDGQVVTPFEVVVPVSSGSVARYPFDSYEAVLLLAVSSGPDGEAAVPFGIEARAVVDGFVLGAATPLDTSGFSSSFAAIEWDASRPATTTVWAVWLMVLMWGLAVSGLLIVWSVVIWRVEIPVWVFAFFVGVLFALPPLRDSLPGRPPPGTIFDFMSFYWSVTIVGTTLILLLGVWLRRARGEARLRDIRHETGH